ncbi:MAG: hypothetical protein U0324_16390 [Polyangiales bacterium]
MRSTSRGSLVALLLLLAGCGSTTVQGTADATPAPDVTAEPGDTPGKPDAQSVCFVDFPCAPWQRFTCGVDGRWQPLVSQPCEAVCPPGPCSGGVCSPSGAPRSCPAGTRCVMFAGMTMDPRDTPCEPVVGDGGVSDGGVSDGAVDAAVDASACPLPESAADCATDADCATIARQCYCGQQPVDGVNARSLAAATACETGRGEHCALGCAVFDGRLAQDGRSVTDGGVIAVRCERDAGVGRCRTFAAP